MDRRMEQATIAAGWIGTGIVVLGAVAAAVRDFIPASFQSAAIYLWAVGVTLIGVATIVAFNTDTLRHVRDGGDRYERLRREGRLRTATILMRLLMLVGVGLFAILALERAHLIPWRPSPATILRGAALHLVAMAGAMTYAHYQSLFVALPRDKSDLRRSITILLATLSLALVASACFATATGSHILTDSAVAVEDAPLMLLAAAIIMAAVVAMARGLPSLASAIFDPGRLTAGGYSPENRAQMMPILVAFTILGGFVLVLIVFSAGILSVLQTAGENGLVLIALLLMTGAVIGGIWLTIRTGKQADRTALFREQTPRDTRDQITILATSLPVALTFLVAGIVLVTGRSIGPITPDAWIHVGTFGILLGVGPYGYYAGRRQRRIRMMEERFPDFLRDLASSHRGGLTLVGAVQVAARGEYGPLSPEVEKMADQISWNVSFDEALGRMAERVRTPLVRRTISLILEASRSGGNTADVLMAAARDARELKTLERQRRINMSVYTLVIYVVFFVFLFVIGVLYDQFVPEILKANDATKGSQFEGLGGLEFGGVSLEDYRRFYYTGGVVQGIGNGILAGVMGSGSVSLGLRHAFWMVAITYVTFAFLLV